MHLWTAQCNDAEQHVCENLVFFSHQQDFNSFLLVEL